MPQYPNPGMPPAGSQGMSMHNSPYGMSPSPIPSHAMSPNPQSNPNLLQPPGLHPNGSPRPNSTGE